MAVFSQISGPPRVGSVIVEQGSANGGETFTSREWQHSATSGGSYTAIPGETAAGITVPAISHGKFIRCVVAWDDGGSPVNATSNIIGPIGRTGSGGGSKKNSTKAVQPPAPPPAPTPEPPMRKARRIVQVDVSKWHPDRRPRS